MRKINDLAKDVMAKRGISKKNQDVANKTSHSPEKVEKTVDKWEIIYFSVMKTADYDDSMPENADFVHNSFVKFYEKFKASDKEAVDLIRLFKAFLKNDYRDEKKSIAIRKKTIMYESEIISISEDESKEMEISDIGDKPRKKPEENFQALCVKCLKKLHKPFQRKVFKSIWIEDNTIEKTAESLKKTERYVKMVNAEIYEILNSEKSFGSLQDKAVEKAKKKERNQDIYTDSFANSLSDDMISAICENPDIIHDPEFMSENEYFDLRNELRKIAHDRYSDGLEAWHIIGAKKGESSDKYPDLLDWKEKFPENMGLWKRIHYLAGSVTYYNDEDIQEKPEFKEKVYKIKGNIAYPRYIPLYRRSKTKKPRFYRITAKLAHDLPDGYGFDRSKWYSKSDGLLQKNEIKTDYVIPYNMEKRISAFYQQNQRVINDTACNAIERAEMNQRYLDRYICRYADVITLHNRQFDVVYVS